MSVEFARHLEERLSRQNSVWTLPAGQVHVWSLSLDKIPAELDGLRPLLPEAEWGLSLRYERESLARAFVLRRILLRHLLARYARCRPLDVSFSLGPRGKPKAQGAADGLGFSASSSGSRALFAFATGAELGVDIEGLHWHPGLEEVALRYFNPAERASLAAAPQELRPRQFFHIWTRKEAEAKLSGEGLRSLEEAAPGQAHPRSVAHELPVAEAYAAHLAVPENRFEIKVLHWSPDWLYNPQQKKVL